MGKNGLKNIIILKNLPSNIIDEAIVVFKNTAKIKTEYKKINENNNETIDKEESEDFFIKEAENVISDYISKIEEQDISKNKENENLLAKCKKLKFISIAFAIFSLVLFILNLV